MKTLVYYSYLALQDVAQQSLDVRTMFGREDLEVFGAFALVIVALLWFLGYVILQARMYKNLYLEEVEYNKLLAEAESERSRIALETMEAVRQTMEEKMRENERGRNSYMKNMGEEKDRDDTKRE